MLQGIHIKEPGLLVAFMMWNWFSTLDEIGLYHGCSYAILRKRQTYLAKGNRIPEHSQKVQGGEVWRKERKQNIGT